MRGWISVHLPCDRGVFPRHTLTVSRRKRIVMPATIPEVIGFALLYEGEVFTIILSVPGCKHRPFCLPKNCISEVSETGLVSDILFRIAFKNYPKLIITRKCGEDKRQFQKSFFG